MTDGQRIVSYSNGMETYYNYLSFYMGEKFANPKLIANECNIINAKAAFLALFFVLEKEDMVEKGENTNFSSKIIDEELANSIEVIAKKVGNTYKIGDYEEENPANIIALIRNKFAHGDYNIEMYERKIVIKTDGKTLKLDIDNLLCLVLQSINNLIILPKCSSISRLQVMNANFFKTNIEHIDSRKDAEFALKLCNVYECTLFSIDGSDIDSETMKEFHRKLAEIRKCSTSEADFKAKLNEARAYFSKKNYVLDTKKIKISTEDANSIIDLAESMNLYNIPNLYGQIHILSTKAIKRIKPDYEDNDILTGLARNLEMLDKMDVLNNFNIFDLWGEDSLSYFNVMDECLVSALAAHFCTMYIYPLERIYLDGEKYSVDRSNQLDFAKLNLSRFKPNKLEIYDTPLKQSEIEYNAKMRSILEIKNKKEQAKKSLEIVTSKGNIDAISKIRATIDRYDNILVNLCSEFVEIEKRYNEISEDYKVNKKYFENRAIIEGIRNAIAHGNICIKRFDNIIDIDDTIISFQDIYEGELVFDLDITIRDFETLFLEWNIGPIIKFLNNRGNDKLTICAPLKYPNEEEKEEVKPKETEEVVEEKGFQKIIKRIFKKNKKSND